MGKTTKSNSFTDAPGGYPAKLGAAGPMSYTIRPAKGLGIGKDPAPKPAPKADALARRNNPCKPAGATKRTAPKTVSATPAVSPRQTMPKMGRNK